MPKKTVIIGLGGTGDWVLTFLKSRLYAAYGEAETAKDIQFLLLDTIHAKTREDAFSSELKKFQVRSAIDQHEEEVAHLGGVRVEGHEYLPLTGEIHQLAESIRQGQDAHTRHLSWFTADYYLRALPAAAMNITDGAGQWRQFGRISLVLSAERGDFTRRIEKLIQAANLPAGDALMFYLVSSLAGGTGAGIFLDAAALIRDVAGKLGVKVWIVAFLVLPSAFRRVLGETTMRATVTRSFAAFRELIRFQTQAGQGVPFRIRYSLNAHVDVTAKLFDTVFVFDAQTEWKSLADLPPWTGISPSIADGLEVFIDRTAGSAVLQDLINASARMASEVRMDETLPAQFHSMGSHKIVLPARQYAAIFASRFVGDLLTSVFPTSERSGIQKLLRTERRDDEYWEFAAQFVRKIPSLFTQIVDLHPDQPESAKKLRAFATRELDEYRSLLRPRETPSDADLRILTVDVLRDLRTGKEIGDNAKDAASRLVRECQRKLQSYQQKLDDILSRLVEQHELEIAAAVRGEASRILNRQVDGFSDHTVGTTLAVLDQIVVICDDLSTKVLAPTEAAIDAQASGQNSLGHWETQISLAQTAMEATEGFDSFFKRSRAWDAQRAYLEIQKGFVERRRLAATFQAFHAIVGALKNQASTLARQLRDWAETAALSDQSSARRQAESDVADLESALLRAGESFTSSYGLTAYEAGARVDVSMGGYREELYDRLVRPVLEEWLRAPEWEITPATESEGGESASVFRLGFTPPGSERRHFEARSGKELHQQIYDAVKDELVPKVTSLSIFDYFLSKGFTPRQVGDFLKENTGPLLGALMPIAGAAPAHSVQLLVQQPREQQAVEFLHDLKNHLNNIFDKAPLQESQQPDFDNPYSLTLLYLVQDIRQGQLGVMSQYEKDYNDQILETDNYVVNHVFRCEQEAARVEKRYRYATGQQGYDGWTRLHPRIARLLDNPGRLRLYLQLWALDIIRIEADPSDKTQRVWMVLPPGADAQDQRVVWLTAPDTGESRSRGAERSVLLAMERFCFVERSARPQSAIRIEYRSLEKGLREKRNTLIHTETDDPFAELIARYESFIDEALAQSIEKGCSEVHSKQEAEDLIIAAKLYLSEELDNLRKG